ncbi:uncharacterized protein K460DRAFT_420210 [Cucurbitaria berberidis CBS 394.84]|uniref:Uncharacterized protein n=1 Tax=Cucurbitaria berberidis CBS 394.84 TaxID=1168544 RepID=A0A9P4GBE4_9PLEO|nr:uncharacterized protein K460DRAFT_420210 [Cucurbitaria berberidis CBS 394.84]KAF1842291.1 hypothetical protein K460DRAFT_420210 [Cucurbitaria berberidis CBS 394.84]
MAQQSSDSQLPMASTKRRRAPEPDEQRKRHCQEDSSTDRNVRYGHSHLARDASGRVRPSSSQLMSRYDSFSPLPERDTNLRTHQLPGQDAIGYAADVAPADEVPARGIASTPQQSPRNVTIRSIPVVDLTGASNWLNRASKHPCQTQLEAVPGIPVDFVKDFTNEPAAYTPEDIWTLRHLKIPARHRKYLEFQALGDILRTLTYTDQKLWDTWELVKSKTEELQREEQLWYRRHKDREFGENYIDNNGKKKRLLPWDTWLKFQSRVMLINQDGTYKELTVPAPVDLDPPSVVTGGKRGMEDLDNGNTHLPTKRPRCGDSKDDPVDLTEQQKSRDLPQLRFDTTARDQMRLHKKGKGTDERPIYKAEHKEARTGACADYAWMAENDEIEQRVQEQDALQQVSQDRGFTDAENARLDYWKREWPRDEVSLPDHPLINVEDYTPNEEGIYQCFHKDFNCADRSCGHGCCENGYDAKGLKKAIAKAIRTYKSQVERMIENGDLDPRHKFWTNWCNDSIRDIKSGITKEEKKERKKKKRKGRKGRKAVVEEAEHTLNDENSTITEAQLNFHSVNEPDAEAVAAAAAALADKQALEHEETIKANMKMINRSYRDARFREERKKYPDFDLLDAWWAAARKEYQRLPLTSEERALRDLPGGDPSLSDKIPMTKKAPLAQSTPEQPRIEASQQEYHEFDPLFDDPPVGVEPGTEESLHSEEEFDPLFDELPDNDDPPIGVEPETEESLHNEEEFDPLFDELSDNGDPPLDDAELDEYIL